MALCGLHPAVHFISARIDLEREAACDDRVVAQTGAAGRYANCLANAADLSGVRQPLPLEPILAPHASQSQGALVTRVTRLLDPRTSRDAHLRWASTGASILAFATAVLISPAAQPLVVVLGTIAGAAPVHLHPAIGRTESRPATALAPPWPSTIDTVPAPTPDTASTSEALAAAPALEPVPPSHPVSLVRQFSWTMPSGLANAAPAPVEPIRPLPAAPLEPRPLSITGYLVPAQSLGREPDPASDSAWRAAGYTGAAVGIGVARAGLATGTGSRKAGTAVAGFFSRAGKAVAGGF
jgi:hypothetical protein